MFFVLALLLVEQEGAQRAADFVPVGSSHLDRLGLLATSGPDNFQDFFRQGRIIFELCENAEEAFMLKSNHFFQLSLFLVRDQSVLAHLVNAVEQFSMRQREAVHILILSPVSPHAVYTERLSIGRRLVCFGPK